MFTKTNTACLVILTVLSCYLINHRSLTSVDSTIQHEPITKTAKTNQLSNSSQINKAQVTAPLIKTSPRQKKLLAKQKPIWHKNFPTATEIKTKINAEKRKVGFKRNVPVIVREILLKTDMKYPNIVSEEVFIENANGELELSSYVEYVADHLLAEITTQENVKELKNNFNTLKVHQIDNTSLYRVSLNGLDIDTVKKAIASYESNNAVKFAEPDYIVSNNSVNDPRFGDLWGLHNTGQNNGVNDADIDAPEAWETTTGTHDVMVAVIDTGVDYNHPDLKANIWTNPGESGTDADGNDKASNGIDDDGNGYIDDVHGWDFANNDNDPMDDHSHGTHCAGTIGASGNNNTGVVGVAHNVTIVALKFLAATQDGRARGATSDAIRCINYHNAIGVDISSNSWGGGGYSQSLKNAIDEAANRNILFVAAAGNDAQDIDTALFYPAAYSSANIVSVAATDRNDNLASFSNYGINNTDIGAPGVSILSTTPNSNYRSYSGTSMACPHVAGAAALLKSVNSDMNVEDMKKALMDSSDLIASLEGKVASNGRLNINKALNAEDTPDPVVITSPVNGSEFSTANITFNWKSNSEISDIRFILGSDFGGDDLYSNDGLNGVDSVTVTLPEDGRRIYARLSSLINNEWVHRDTAYIASNADVPAPTKSTLTSPVVGSTLESGLINFRWDSGSQVQRRWLYVGTRKGSGNLYSKSVNETGVNIHRAFFTSKVYVRLWSLLENRWQYNDYSYDTINASSVITSPVNGSKLTANEVSFEWTEGYKVTQRYLIVGSRKGAGDYYSSFVQGTSKSVTIPTDGSTIYVRLWSRNYSSWWHYHDYSYTTPAISVEASKINSHKDRSTFDSEKVTLTWTKGIGVKHNYLYVFGNNTRFSGWVQTNKQNITVPAGSGRITVYLYSYINRKWHRSRYTFYATSSAARITSPTNGSKIYSDSVTFRWNKTSRYNNYLMVGTRPGSGNLYRSWVHNSNQKTVKLNVNGKIYVRLYTYKNRRWSYSDSNYTK